MTTNKDFECIKVKTEAVIRDQELKDLLAGAFEGGSNYWYHIKSYVNPTNLTVEFKHIDLPFIPGCAVIIEELEEPGKEAWKLDRDAIQRGIQLMADEHPRHYNDFREEHDDATTADVFLQLCLFGKLIFG